MSLEDDLAERKEVNLRKKKRLGRPKKSDVEKKKVGNRNKVGRPKGDAAIMNEYKARMLASPKSTKVLDTILNAALDDEHKNQAAAWKIVVDRMLPVGMFEKDVLQSGGKNSIQINITGVGSTSVVGSSNAESTDIIDGEYTDAEEA
jgi:hypothetical protein